MPLSSFYVTAATSIDAVTPTPGWPGNFNVGVLYNGGAKNVLRRALISFDVFGAAAEGRPLTTADVLVSADLLCEVIGLSGPAGFACGIERISRADWDYTTADWNEYRAGSAWTQAGGDVATPPAAVGYASPAALGTFVIAGLLPFVADAIASRGGALHLRHKADDEKPATGQYFALASDLAQSNRIRLRVTYESQAPAPVARPGAADLHAAKAAGASRAADAAAPSRPARSGQARAGG